MYMVLRHFVEGISGWYFEDSSCGFESGGYL